MRQRLEGIAGVGGNWRLLRREIMQKIGGALRPFGARAAWLRGRRSSLKPLPLGFSQADFCNYLLQQKSPVRSRAKKNVESFEFCTAQIKDGAGFRVEVWLTKALSRTRATPANRLPHEYQS